MSDTFNIVLFDGVYHQKLKPLTFTRPVADLRVGIFKIKKKWEHALSTKINFRCKSYLAKKYQSVSGKADIGICSALLPNDNLCDAINELKDKTIMMKEGKVLVIKPLPKEDLDNELNDFKIVQFTSEINIIEKPMDIFKLNGLEIANDLKWILKEKTEFNNDIETNIFIGDQIYIEKGAVVKGATLNSTDGPIYIFKGAEVMEGSNLRGPLVVMENSVVKMGSKIYGPTTIGPCCKVGGEVSNVVFQGYSNKAHDGFMGNSVIGHWCNFGADTNTSNLKNNYGIVKSWSYETGKYESTETLYCGLIAGDHSKSGINTMFNTGSVLGAFVNVFDAGFPPKFIKSFSWGNSKGFETYKFTKAIEVAKTVMSRRAVELDQETINIYKAIFKNTVK